MSFGTKLRLSLAIISTSIFLILSAITYTSWFATRPEPPENFKASAQAKLETQRQPSSIAVLTSQTTSKAFKDQKMLTVDLECIDKNPKLELKSPAKLVRLVGRLCHSGVISDSKITNSSNGFEATTFLLKNKKLTSDYIYLAEGRNKILLSVVNTNGEKVISSIDITHKNQVVIE